MEKKAFISLMLLVNVTVIFSAKIPRQKNLDSPGTAHTQYLKAIKKNDSARLAHVLKTYTLEEISAQLPRKNSLYTPAFANGNPEIIDLLLACKITGSLSKRARKNDLRRLVLTGSPSLLKTALENALVTPKDIDKGILAHARAREKINTSTATSKISCILKQAATQKRHYVYCPRTALEQGASSTSKSRHT